MSKISLFVSAALVASPAPRPVQALKALRRRIKLRDNGSATTDDGRANDSEIVEFDPDLLLNQQVAEGRYLVDVRQDPEGAQQQFEPLNLGQGQQQEAQRQQGNILDGIDMDDFRSALQKAGRTIANIFRSGRD